MYYWLLYMKNISEQQESGWIFYVVFFPHLSIKQLIWSEKAIKISLSEFDLCDLCSQFKARCKAPEIYYWNNILQLQMLSWKNHDLQHRVLVSLK